MTPTSDAVVVRPARAEDRWAVLGFCVQTFSWGDYIGEVWDDWLADPEGQLMVAETAGLPVGVLHLTVPAPGQAWLQGLRVDPAVRRQGVATLLMQQAAEEARARGAAVVRFFTSMDNQPMREIASRLGYQIISARVHLSAPATPLHAPALESAVAAELDALWDLVRLDPAFEQGGRTYCRGWRAVELTRGSFGAHVSGGQVLVARQAGVAVACAIVTRRRSAEALWVSGLFGDGEALGQLAKGLRGYASGLAAPSVELLYADFPPGLLVLANAGYSAAGSGLGMLLFAKELSSP